MENKTQIKRRAVRDMTNAPVMFTEECWANSMLSIARYYGAINYSGYRYIIVDKLGRDLWECSAIAEKEGRDKAIEPGEPADLIREDFKRLYRKYGRDRFIEAIKNNPDVWTPKELENNLKKENLKNHGG